MIQLIYLWNDIEKDSGLIPTFPTTMLIKLREFKNHLWLNFPVVFYVVFPVFNFFKLKAGLAITFIKQKDKKRIVIIRTGRKVFGYYQLTREQKFRSPNSIFKNMNINSTQILLLGAILIFSGKTFLIQRLDSTLLEKMYQVITLYCDNAATNHLEKLLTKEMRCAVIDI